jgi:NAD(P)-dependent dehydrogenase (short-subunit alcohol dehydrogenase family)
MAWILVTPASRGIGHALTKQLLRTTPASIPIVATTRGDKQEARHSLLEELGLDEKSSNRLDVQNLDVLKESSISDLAGYCKDRYQKSPTDQGKPSHLRLGLLIPGMLHPEKSPAQIDYEKALETLKLNLLAPMMLLKHFSQFLPKKAVTLSAVDGLPGAAVLACMSARVGSITDNGKGGWYSYRSSKAGVNQVVKSADLHFKTQSGHNACVIGLHPGTVKTGLSKGFWESTPKDQLFTPEYSAEKLLEVVGKIGDSNIDEYRGRCWDYKGDVIAP